jgi:hypothetical protein
MNVWPVGDSAGHKLRRYTVKTIEPCVLERDTSLPEVAARGKMAVDDAGNVYILATQPALAIKRVSPGATITCSNPSSVTLPGYNERTIAIAPDGTYGYGAFFDYDFDIDKEVNPKIVKITADATSCSFTPFTPTGVTIADVASLGIDGKGRLHVADDEPRSVSGNERVVILDSNAAFVAEYQHPSSGFTSWNPDSLTRCHRGICMSSDSDVLAVNDDGTFVGRSYFSRPSSYDGLAVGFRSHPRGALYYVTTSYGSGGSASAFIHVSILKDR